MYVTVLSNVFINIINPVFLYLYSIQKFINEMLFGYF